MEETAAKLSAEAGEGYGDKFALREVLVACWRTGCNRRGTQILHLNKNPAILQCKNALEW